MQEYNCEVIVCVPLSVIHVPTKITTLRSTNASVSWHQNETLGKNNKKQKNFKI